MATDAGNASPIAVNLAADNEIVVGGDAQLLEKLGELRRPRHREDAFDPRLASLGANDVWAQPVAQEPANGVDDDGLAGAGLAGEDDQARAQLDVHVVDDGKVFDR